MELKAITLTRNRSTLIVHLPEVLPFRGGFRRGILFPPPKGEVRRGHPRGRSGGGSVPFPSGGVRGRF